MVCLRFLVGVIGDTNTILAYCVDDVFNIHRKPMNQSDRRTNYGLLLILRHCLAGQKGWLTVPLSGGGPQPTHDFARTQLTITAACGRPLERAVGQLSLLAAITSDRLARPECAGD